MSDGRIPRQNRMATGTRFAFIDVYRSIEERFPRRRALRTCNPQDTSGVRIIVALDGESSGRSIRDRVPTCRLQKAGGRRVVSSNGRS